MSPSKSGRRLPGLLLLMLLVAAALRIYGVGDQSFWLDEVLTLQNAAARTFEHEALPWNSLITEFPDQTHLRTARPWYSVWNSQQRDVHPPLYFVALRLWMELIGEGETNVRCLSVLFSVAAIPLLYLAVRTTRDHAPALWAALLMTLAGPQILYGQEARMYALLLLLSTATLLVARRIETEGAAVPRLLALALLVLAMVLTHYFAIAPLLGLFIYLMIRLPRPAKLRSLGAFVAAGLLFLVVWGAVPITHSENFSARSAFLVAPGEGHILKTLIRFALFPLKQFTAWDPPEHPAFVLLLVLWLAPIPLLRRRPEQWLWYSWILASVLLLAVIDLVRASNQLSPVRYTIVAAPALFALVSTAFADTPMRLLRHALPAAAALLSLLTLPFVYEQTKPNWQGVADHLHARAGPSDILIFLQSDNRRWYPQALQLILGHYHHPTPQRILLLDDAAPPEARSALATSPRLWVFAAGETDLSRFLPTLKDVKQLASVPGVVTIWEARAQP